MRNSFSREAILVFVAGALLGPVQVLAHPDPPSVAAAVLLNRFETVFYAQSSLVSGTGGFGPLSDEHVKFLRFPFAYLRGALERLGNNASGEILENGDAVLVGAKDFRPPNGLGRVGSNLCYVIILKQASTLSLRKYFRGNPEGSAKGASVWNWAPKLAEFGESDPRPSSVYATQIAESYVLVSNDLREVQAVAEQLSSPDGVTKELTRIDGWDSIRQHPMWGYRSYRQTDVVDLVAAGMADITPTARALVFLLDAKEKRGVLRLVAADEGTAANINKRAVLPALESVSSGVWTTTIPLVHDQETFKWMFAVRTLFGFSIYT